MLTGALGAALGQWALPGGALASACPDAPSMNRQLHLRSVETLRGEDNQSAHWNEDAEAEATDGSVLYFNSLKGSSTGFRSLKFAGCH